VYRGASACLVRDIPFSAIYFPAYAACKDALVQRHDSCTVKASHTDIILAGTIAGVPAALLTAPADVVKCRLQSIVRPGEASYAGILDCASKVYQQEGITAFFQGAFMRVLRIAPQFGLSLLVYENLVNFIGFERASCPPTNLPIDPRDYLDAFPHGPSKRVGLFEQWFHSPGSR
jgi:solute carrier family 25 (mitochondrial aspartate/glutamate transporter), member 12/13